MIHPNLINTMDIHKSVPNLILILSIFIQCFTFIAVATEVNAPETPRIDDIIIDDFDKGKTHGVYYNRKNSLGKYHGTWSKRPSYTLISKSETYRIGDQGRGLVMDFKKDRGWCGWHTILGVVDASKHNIFSFWVKGKAGGERFEIGFIDKERDSLKMDAVYAGPVDLFSPDGVTTEWKEVKIPLSRIISQVNVSELTMIVIWFPHPGEGTIYLDNMTFKWDPEIDEIEESNFPVAGKHKEYSRSMWVWKIDPVLNLEARKEMLALCWRTSIEIIYLYIGEFPAHGVEEYTESLRSFLSECHHKGISVELLTGNPTWTLKENHEKAINWLRPFLEYNNVHPVEERFHGASIDVEPYLLSEWKTDKDRIKEEYLILIKKYRDLIDSYPKMNFKFGCAVPIFYSEDMKFEEELLDMVDYFALMDYYDSADEIIKNGQVHIDLATKMGKKIWLGIEIQDLVSMNQGMRRNTFYEEGWESMEKELAKVSSHFDREYGYGGIAIHCYYAYKIHQRDTKTSKNQLRLQTPEKKIAKLNSYRKTLPKSIDGKLSDWSENSYYEIAKKKNVVFGKSAWRNKSDLSCKIYSAWDESTLYMAFDMTDDKIVQKKTGFDLWEGDHIEFWLDVDLGEDFIEATNSNDDIQFGFSPGDFNKLPPEACIWTPDVKNKLNPEIEIAAAKTKSGYAIEVAILRHVLYNEKTASQMSMTDVIYSKDLNAGKQVRYTQRNQGTPAEEFYAGYQMGISVEVSDTDDSRYPQKVLMSTALDRVWGDPTTFGYLVFKDQFKDGDSNQIIPDSDDDDAESEATGMQEDNPDGEIVVNENKMVDKSSSAAKSSRLELLHEIPEFHKSIRLSARESEFSYRGKMGAYKIPPNNITTSIDNKNGFNAETDAIVNDEQFELKEVVPGSIKIHFENIDQAGFCGSYIMFLADLTQYKTLTFLVKGAVGGEVFDIGLNDHVANKREDAVFVGSIYRYLPDGVSTDWQIVKIPIEDFFGPDISTAYSMVFLFADPGEGSIWIDEMRFSQELLVDRESEINENGYLLLDDFDYSDLNLLGRKAAAYKRLPSFCLIDRVAEPHYGEKGKSLQLKYNKKESGWCGYYTLMNQIDGAYFDLSNYDKISFYIKGEAGGENFEMGMADSNWITIGDSIKAGQITKYLKNGVTTEWQNVEIPLKNFGNLDFPQMGAFVMNFDSSGVGTVYIDDIKMHLKDSREEESNYSF